MPRLIAFCSGLLFAIGLGVAGMAQPSKVIAFLDVAGAWDPSLAFVMGGAIAIYAPVAWLLRRRSRTVLGSSLELPTATAIDRRLLFGAALFGVGWGLSGYCPGPALISLTTLATPALVFGLAMLTGMAMHALCQRK